MICKVCGRTISNEEANFCEYCGASFRELRMNGHQPLMNEAQVVQSADLYESKEVRDYIETDIKITSIVVDENKCIGCGVCTTKCEFDAIKLHREHPECSTMVNSDDKMKAILPYMIKRKIAIKKAKKG